MYAKIWVKKWSTKILKSENKIGLPASKVMEEMNKLRLNKISSKRKCDRIMDRIKELPTNHKQWKKKQ